MWAWPGLSEQTPKRKKRNEIFVWINETKKRKEKKTVVTCVFGCGTSLQLSTRFFCVVRSWLAGLACELFSVCVNVCVCVSTAQQPNGVSAVLLVEREREKEKSRAPGKKCADRPASLVVVNFDYYCVNSQIKHINSTVWFVFLNFVIL
jgi:hypothetical protein